MGDRLSRLSRKRRPDSLELGDGPFVSDITRIQCGFGFDQDDVNFFVRNGTVLYAFGHDDEFAGADYGFAVAELHAQRALHDEK